MMQWVELGSELGVNSHFKWQYMITFMKHNVEQIEMVKFKLTLD